MAFLLELKESFKKFYNRYNTYIVPASKFIIALICFIMINTSIGYMDKLKNPVFALLLSVICAFLPGGFTLIDRKSTRLNSSHPSSSRMPSSA